MVDPKGNATEYVYNGYGDLIQVISPDTGTTYYDYDAAGNRIRQTDAKGQVTEYRYDALNRLTQIIDPSQTSASATMTPMPATASAG